MTTTLEVQVNQIKDGRCDGWITLPHVQPWGWYLRPQGSGLSIILEGWMDHGEGWDFTTNESRVLRDGEVVEALSAGNTFTTINRTIIDRLSVKIDYHTTREEGDRLLAIGMAMMGFLSKEVREAEAAKRKAEHDAWLARMAQP